MWNPREDAAVRVGHRWNVRVLEPSPPAVTDPPWFADDPVDGGEVVPVERPGARSWASVCEDDPALREWCEDRWLVRGRLAPLPPSFAETRDALHAVAEHVLAPARYRAVGRVGLRFTYHGFGTPFLGADRQLRVERGVLCDESGAAEPLTTVAAAAAFAGVEPGAPAVVYQPTTTPDLEAPLPVDPGAARALGAWYGLCTLLLEQMRADAAPDDAPSRVQLWPEHFDVAIDLGPGGRRANYGGSPGDGFHPDPYVYVGPWDPGGRADPFWNAPFGAVLGYGEILAGADPLAFLRRGKALLAR